MKKLFSIFLFSIFLIGFASAQLTSPTVYWKFNEQSGNAIDSQGINNLTQNNSNTLSGYFIGKLNNAMKANFSASNPVIFNTTGHTNFAFGTGNFSIIFWFNGTKSTGSYNFMTTDQTVTTGWGLTQENNAQNISFVNNNIIVTGTNTVYDGNWHRIAFIRNGTGANQFGVYVDNNFIRSATLSSDITDVTTAFKILAPNEGSFQIDDLRIYDGYAMNLTDINTDWASGLGQELGSIITTTSLIAPLNNYASASNPLFFSGNGTVIGNGASIRNMTLYIWLNNGTLFKTNTTSSLAGNNSLSNLSLSGFTLNNYLWNYYTCGTNSSQTSCSWATSNRTLIWGVGDIIESFVNGVYETDRQYYNITFNVSSGTPTAKLWFNGTNYTGSATNILGDQWRFSTSFDLPTSPGTKNLFWEINAGTLNYNTTVQTQVVSAINFTIFGASPQNNPYLNFTFKNETTALENVNATISGTFTYWLGSGTINKTYSFTNTTENQRYAFAFSPINKTINLVTDIVYDNGESQQRSFEQTSTFTNLTTTQVLYLLPNNDGLYNPFTVVDSTSNPLQGVLATISRTIDGSTVTIASTTTDSSGFVTFFLNPDFTYTALFSKAGYPTQTITFTPTTDVRTVIMGSAGGSLVSNGTDILQNTSYQTFPLNGTLLNNTNYTFGFNVSSTQPITFMSMNITNRSGYQLLYVTNAGDGFISGILNTGNYSQLNGYFTIQTATETFTFTKVWRVTNDFEGDYSLSRQLGLYLQYDFQMILQYIIVIAIIFLTLMYMGGIEQFDNSESRIVVVLLIVWAFSFLGWLNTGIISTSTNSGISTFAQFSNQYGIAILTSGASFYFITRRLFG